MLFPNLINVSHYKANTSNIPYSSCRKLTSFRRFSCFSPQFVCYHRKIYGNVWTHVVFTWNRKTRKGKLYFNGFEVGEKTSDYQGQDIDLNLTNHTVYEIGFKKDTGEVLQGSLRDLAVFLRTLSPDDVYKLYSTFCLILFVR